MGPNFYFIAPVGVVLGRYNTEGMKVPRLGHLAQGDNGVLLRVILQDVIIIFNATYNYYNSVMIVL